MLLLLVAALAAAPHKSGVKWAPLTPEPPAYEKSRRTPPSPAATAQETPAPVPAGQNTVPLAEAPQPKAVATPNPVAQQGPAGQLNLTCLGAGTANKLKSARVFGNSNYSGSVGYTPYSGSSSGSATVLGTQDRPFADQVDVRLFGGDDRIRLPRTMLPPIHGGDGGWFKLKISSADSRSIQGKAAVNFMNNPNVFIDRVTGVISISGKAGDYSGQCQLIDKSAPAKF